MFIYLRLYQIAEYFMEASRILKGDGLIIFNYFDISCDTDVDKFCMVVSEQKNSWAEVYKDDLLKKIGMYFGFEHYKSNVSKRSNDFKNMFITFRLRQKR